MTYIFWALQCIVVQEHSLCHVIGFMITSVEWTHWWKFSSEDGKISIKWSWTDLLGMIQCLPYVLFLLMFSISFNFWDCGVLLLRSFQRILFCRPLHRTKSCYFLLVLNVRCVSLFKNFCFRIAVRCLHSAFSLKIHLVLFLASAIGTLRSDDATAAKTSLQKWICVLSVFIAIIPTHLLCQM